MFGYLARRLATMIPTLLLVAIAVFALVRLIPGDPVAGDARRCRRSRAGRAAAAQLGLDQPIPLQFLHWIAKLATGDFGHSITNNLAVLPLILDRFQVSAIIVLVAVGLAACIAVPAGLSRRGSRIACSISPWSAAPRCSCRSRASGSACCCCCCSGSS